MPRGDRECKMESPTTDHSPFCGEDYEHIQIPDPRAQSPEGKDSLKKKKMNTCNERKQPEELAVKSANKDHSKNEKNIEGKRDYSLQTHSKDLYNRRKRSKSGKKEMKVPHTEVKKCASKRRLGPFNL